MTKLLGLIVPVVLLVLLYAVGPDAAMIGLGVTATLMAVIMIADFFGWLRRRE